MVQALPPGRTDPQQKMQPRVLPGPGRPQSRVPLPDSFSWQVTEAQLKLI